MNFDEDKIMARAFQLSQDRMKNGQDPLDEWLKAWWEIKTVPAEGTIIDRTMQNNKKPLP